MFQENELIHLLISVGILIFVIIYWKELAGFYHIRLLIAAFLFLLASGIFTLMEGVFWYGFFNGLEHLCDLLRTVVILIWGSLLVLPEK